MVVGSFWLAVTGLGIVWKANHSEGQAAFPQAFRRINLYALLVVAFLSFSSVGVSGD